MQEGTIPAKATGRYLIEPAQGEARGTLIGFHGYGENADISLALLQRLPGAKQWVTSAIQALNVFYSRSTGQVVACWMTRQNREEAIANNVAYVDDALDRIAAESAPRPWVFVGFSQGAAMAYRAAAHGRHGAEGLIIASGDVPPDVTDGQIAALPPILLGHGRQDSWYTTTKFEEDVQRLSAAGAVVTDWAHEGGHDWHPELSEAAAKFLTDRSATRG